MGPATSPTAKMLGKLVRSSGSTATVPWSLIFTPSSSRPKPLTLGCRPTAMRIWSKGSLTASSLGVAEETLFTLFQDDFLRRVAGQDLDPFRLKPGLDVRGDFRILTAHDPWRHFDLGDRGSEPGHGLGHLRADRARRQARSGGPGSPEAARGCPRSGIQPSRSP